MNGSWCSEYATSNYVTGLAYVGIMILEFSAEALITMEIPVGVAVSRRCVPVRQMRVEICLFHYLARPRVPFVLKRVSSCLIFAECAEWLVALQYNHVLEISTGYYIFGRLVKVAQVRFHWIVHALGNIFVFHHIKVSQTQLGFFVLALEVNSKPCQEGWLYPLFCYWAPICICVEIAVWNPIIHMP